MKFEDVQKLHDQLDCQNGWDDDGHFRMQAYCRTSDELLVVRFGGFHNQAYLHRLPADHTVPDGCKPLIDANGDGTGIPICGYVDGVLYAGWYYDDLHQEPYDPNSGEPGVLDVDMSGDWKLSDIEHLERVAEDYVSEAAYDLECYKKALDAIRNN